jgi:hypothetical protein
VGAFAATSPRTKEGLHEGGAGGSEVADVGSVGSLPEVDRLHELGNHEVQVEIALAVPVAAEVDGHSIEEGGEIRSVVEVEATQEELVGFPRPRVLRRDEPGYHLE